MVKIPPNETIIASTLVAGTSTVNAGISSLCGHSIGLLKGAGFGFVQGAIAQIALVNMPKFLPQASHLPVSMGVGALAGYGVSHAAAAMGFIAFPITAPSALILTIGNLALIYLLQGICGSYQQ